MDIDFESERREEVIDYIVQRFGKDHTAQIITYGTEKLRSGIIDLCRTLKKTDENGNVIEYGPDIADAIKENVPFQFPDHTDPTYIKMEKLAQHPDEFKDAFENRTEAMHKDAISFMESMKQYPELSNMLKKIEGQVRSFGKHAAAVVITDEPITDHIPVYLLKKDDKMPVTAFSMKEVDEDLQMLKLDALGLSTMTILRKAVENINRMHGIQFKLKNIPLNDQQTLKTIRDGHTIGIFQLAGGPITTYTKQVRPSSFNDVVDILAGYRPGPMKAEVEPGVTMTDKYIENADAENLRKYLLTIPEKLRPIYQQSRGVLLYQEQIMSVAQEMAGYTLGGADILRRAVSKKVADLIEAVRYEFVYGTDKAIPMLEERIQKMDPVKDKKKMEIFKKELKSMKKKAVKVDGAIHRGYDEDYAINIYNGIEKFAEYCFNRSHSVCYAVIAIWTAYLKTHYPVEFMAAQLTVQAGSTDDTIVNIQECRRLNIPILPPDINKSDLGFGIEFIEDESGKMIKAIRYGLDSIKGIGEKVVKEIISKPAIDGQPDSQGSNYQDIDDFYNRVDKRVVNKGYFEKLIKAGCFDFDIQNRYAMLNHYNFNLRKDKEFLGTYEEFLKAKKAKKVKADTNFRLRTVDYDEDVLCGWEQELFGFYLSYHPYADLPYEAWDQVREHQMIDMGGKIISIKKIKTKKQDNMCFLTVETAGGKIEITVFPNQFTEFQTELFKGNIAIFRGRKKTQNDKASLILDKVLKTRKKKFAVEKPPELEQLALDRKRNKKGEQLTMDIFQAPVRPDPLADTFENMTDGKAPVVDEQEFDLATLFN